VQSKPQSSSLQLDSVTLTYPGRTLTALQNVSLAVAAGEHLGVCGRTGAGKSSLLNAIFQLADLDAGAIRIGGADVASMSSRCGHNVVFLGSEVRGLIVCL
jgi:ABC-type multidrug transport system fused ATPase/permease subunit